MTFQVDAHVNEATFWEFTGQDGFGTDTYAAPILVNVRWEERTDLIILDKEVREPSRAEIWTDRKMANGSYLALGDHTGTANPREVDDAEITRGYREIGSITGNEVERKVFL